MARSRCSTRRVIAVVQTVGVARCCPAWPATAWPGSRTGTRTRSSTRSSRTLLIPAAVTFVPSFVLVSSLGWISTLRGLIIPGLFQAFATFLFRQYFLGFPKEIEEAARIDGLGYWGTFWRIVVPNSWAVRRGHRRPSPSSAAWNAFLWPLVIGQDQSSWTVQIALSTFLTAQTINLHELFVAAAVAILPLRRHVRRSCSAGSSRAWSARASTSSVPRTGRSTMPSGYDPLAGQRGPGEPEFDVLLAGTVFLDIIFTGLPALPTGGTEVWAEGMGSCPGGIANLAIGRQPARPAHVAGRRVRRRRLRRLLLAHAGPAGGRGPEPVAAVRGLALAGDRLDGPRPATGACSPTGTRRR